MSLYLKTKSLLGDVKSVISDEESLLLNRRDFHITQISPVHATMTILGAKLGYPYRVLIAFVDNIVAGLREQQFNIVLSDPSLTLAALQCYLRGGGRGDLVKVYAPKGCGALPERDDLLGEIIHDFRANTITTPNAKPDASRREFFTLVLGNTKTADQTIFAADRFLEAEKGVLILKDYTKLDAKDEREYLESKLIFPAMLYEGHAVSFKI